MSKLRATRAQVIAAALIAVLAGYLFIWFVWA